MQRRRSYTLSHSEVSSFYATRAIPKCVTPPDTISLATTGTKKKKKKSRKLPSAVDCRLFLGCTAKVESRKHCAGTTGTMLRSTTYELNVIASLQSILRWHRRHMQITTKNYTKLHALSTHVKSRLCIVCTTRSVGRSVVDWNTNPSFTHISRLLLILLNRVLLHRRRIVVAPKAIATW